MVHRENVSNMSNIAGKRVKTDESLPFSFYFGEKNSSNDDLHYGISVKFNLNPEKCSNCDCYILEIHGDYICHCPNVSNSSLKTLRSFFKKYKVIFAGVCEGVIPEDSVTAYFRHFLTLPELLQDCEFYSNYLDQLVGVTTIEEFENVVRHYNIFNMND